MAEQTLQEKLEAQKAKFIAFMATLDAATKTKLQPLLDIIKEKLNL